jgi:mono/diheme cytochrome c family protein
MSRPLYIAGGGLLVAAIGAVVLFTGGSGGPAETTVEVKVPELSRSAAAGGKLFAENCQACHGVNAAGSENGPPLVHRIYEPSHHADMAFFRAVSRGVKAHHWNFGDMPPIRGIGSDELRDVVAYVRELQSANGIQ